MSKNKLIALSDQMQALFEQITQLSDKNRSIMTSTRGEKESFGAIIDNFETKLTTFRQKLLKIAVKMPK